MKTARNWTAAILAWLIVSLILGGSNSQASTTGDAWRARASAAATKFAALDDGKQRVFPYAYMASAIGNLYGWDDPRVATYLTKVRSMRLPDGGYGLNYSIDEFGDGTWNSATTAYTVTMADHVGPVLLEAYQNGKASKDEISALANYVAHIPLLSGNCMPYSNSPNDRASSYYCIHNVSASASLWLTNVVDAGIPVWEQAWITLNIDRRETAAYLPYSGNWNYSDVPGRGLSDIDHTALSTEWALSHAPAIGRAMLAKIMTTSFPTDQNAPLAHFRLSAFDCANSTRWFAEFDSWLANPPGTDDGIRYAQLARWAARNAKACS